MLRTKGGQQGNKNAAKPGRKRVKFEISLSDTKTAKRLTFFEQQSAHEIYAKTEERRTPTDEEIAKVAREMFYAWVDSLM